MFDNVLKNIALIEENKATILDLWFNYDIVEEKLITNDMSVSFFREKFASKVFDYAISVVKAENKAGDCPVIGVMLMLFKKKNIPLSDIFIICVHFKNALLHFFQKNDLLDEGMLRELSMMMDYNFEGVINEYVILYYKDTKVRAIKPESKVCPIKKDDYEEQVTHEKEEILESTATTSAEMYLQDVEVDMDAVDELDELESDTLDAIDAEETLDKQAFSESANLFNKYAHILSSMYEFEELSYTLIILRDLLNEIEFDSIDEETRYMVKIYLKAIISDLQSWRMAIFITMKAEDIHYLDKTLMSSIAQIQMTLIPPNEAEVEDEIEFF